MAKQTRRHFLKATAGTVLLSVSPIGLAGEKQAEFVAVRVWPAQAYTRITLESSLPLKYHQFMLQNPDRVVLDISDAQLNKVIQGLPEKVLQRDPYLKNIRVAQYQSDIIRIVFDLKALVDPQVFALLPIEQFQNRLVVDLYPAVIRVDEDPLLLLLQDYRDGNLGSDGSIPANARSSVSSPMTSSGEDVLGSKIEDILAENKNQNSGANQRRQRKRHRPVVVLDPGHGGEDPGATGKSGLHEKNVVLQIARQAKKNLENMGYKVYMTRNEDVLIPLRVRVAKARKLKADAFVSIHADSFTRPSARGTGVFVLRRSGATSATAKYLEKTQNSADMIGGVKMVGDPLIDKTLLDLTQTATINDSLKLGKLVLKELGKINKLHKGHVEEANFVVLRAPDVPSILVETAFLSNPTEEKLLSSKSFRNKVAAAISKGVQGYLKTQASLH